MDKTTWLTAEGVTSYDLNSMAKDAAVGLGRAVAALLGDVTGCVSGFTASATTSPSMSINISDGTVIQIAPADADPIGTFLADQTPIVQVGYCGTQTSALDTSGLSAGQSKWYLVQAQFIQSDVIRAGDPTAGRRAFYNSANPGAPLDGINGEGGTIPTVRLGFCNVTVIPGAPGTAGSNVPPQPSANCLPMFLINVSFGQTSIASGDIQIAGPLAYSGYQQAPFLAGLLAQHHLGTPGCAPQIDLTAEVKNILRFANMPATNSNPPVPVSGNNIIAGGAVIVTYVGNGSPNGNQAGSKGDVYVDESLTPAAVWRCRTAGTSSTAVWESLAATTVQPMKWVLIAKAGAFTMNDPSGSFYQVSASAPLPVTLPVSPGDGSVYKMRLTIGSGNSVTLTADPTAPDFIDQAGISQSTLTLNGPYAGTLEIIAIVGGWDVS